MSSNNLLKWGYVNVDPEDVRVIDSNELVSRKLGAMAYASDDEPAGDYMMQEFDVEEDESIAALFGEGEDGAPEGGMEGDAQDYPEGEADDDGFEEGINAETYVMSEQEAKRIIEEAHQEAKRIVEQAEQDAKTVAEQAHAQAKIVGKQEGYQEGIAKAQQEIEKKEAEIRQLAEDMKRKYDERLAEMEPMLVATLSGIYEHLIGVEISQYKSVLMHLIDHTLHSVEASQSYLIHVSEQDFSYVSMKKGELLEEGGQSNATIEVIEDKTLSKNQCLVETDSGIFDCSLSVQLEELKRKLILLSYGQKGE